MFFNILFLSSNIRYTNKSYASIFFFSGRCRHTISKRDWSSDVCSSDPAPSRREVNDIRIPELQQLLDDGHIVVASDYPGQGLPGQAYYMVGQANARASLDALRTLEHL